MCTIDDPNAKAFLRLIRYAEHYPVDSDDTYLVRFGGGRFADTSKHPRGPWKRWGKTSSAAGAYQILYGTWEEAKAKGIVTDFSAGSQDKLAFSKLKSRGALQFVCDGQVEHACAKLRNEWTSLPGAKETRITMAIAKDAFVRFGGTLK